MITSQRGADALVATLVAAGVRHIFSLSGNHIMPVYDALLGSGIRIVHVRHEAAAVHMADAYARLTGEVGVALVTGGQGHTNAVAALTTAQCADSPVLLLSGHAPLGELGLGAFQELRQADLAAPVAKAAWTAGSATTLAADIARAMALARSGRPGPVHVSLPTDVVEAAIAPTAPPAAEAFRPAVQPVSAATAVALAGVIAAAARPLIVAGPMLASADGRAALAALEAALGVPAVVMESPRGLADPSLGAFADVARSADLIVLLGKPLDFTLRFARAPHVAADCRFAVVDPEPAMLARAAHVLGTRLDLAALGDARSAVEALAAAAAARAPRDRTWLAEARDAIAFRPASWATARANAPDRLHPVEMLAPVADVLARHPDAILVSDGGEIGQWAQAVCGARRRVINGVAGSIGAGLPFALAARIVEPAAPVIAIMGDGTFGFHMAEIDTAGREGLGFVAVVGNDARWNAEHQIQLRDYGAERTHACGLLPSRYDRVAEALGGYGALVTQAGEMAGALQAALSSGRPACLNVMLDGLPAPNIRRG